jgi:hypothetical protein
MGTYSKPLFIYPLGAYQMTTANHQRQSGLTIIGMMHEIEESLGRINAVCSVLSIADSSVGIQQGEAFRLAQIILIMKPGTFKL